MIRKIIAPLIILILASLSCSLPGGVLGPTLTPTPTQTVTPTATTYSQYTYIEVPLQAVLVSDDDGSHAVQITYDEIKIWVDRRISSTPRRVSASCSSSRTCRRFKAPCSITWSTTRMCSGMQRWFRVTRWRRSTPVN